MLDFLNEDEENEDGDCTSDVYLIFISTNEPERLIKYFDGTGSEADKFYGIIDDIENDYGVMDVGFLPEYMVMGYNSYEIEQNDRNAVVNQIRDFLISEGFNSKSMFEGRFIVEHDHDMRLAKQYLSKNDLQKLQSIR